MTPREVTSSALLVMTMSVVLSYHDFWLSGTMKIYRNTWSANPLYLKEEYRDYMVILLLSWPGIVVGVMTVDFWNIFGNTGSCFNSTLAVN